MTALNTRRKALAGSRVLVLGVAYKSDIDDMRESPAIKVIDLLLEHEAEVVYHDPYVSSYSQGGRTAASVDLTEAEVARADAVLIITGHKNVDYDLVVRSADLILDTRNVLASFDSNKVVLL
jgi:UDP-N-acetyl-D-glucosamine dehydrogenase